MSIMLLREKISQVLNIFIFSKENYLFAKYLYKPATEEELNYLQNSRHFIFIRFSMWKVCIIELHKLTSSSSNDSFSFNLLINALERDKEFGSKIPKEVLARWKNALEAVKKETYIISNLRNKYYAHTDSNRHEYPSDISFEEIESVIKAIELIITEIYSYALDSCLSTETPIFGRSRFDILKTLAKEKLERLAKIRSGSL